MAFKKKRETGGLRWRTAIVKVKLEGKSYQRAHDACHQSALLWDLAVAWVRGEWDAGNHKVNILDIQHYLIDLPKAYRPL